MGRVAEEARAEQASSRRMHVALALTGLAIAGLAVLGLAAQADAASDPSASAFLEGAVKPQMQKTLRKKRPRARRDQGDVLRPDVEQDDRRAVHRQVQGREVGLLGTYKLKATLANGGKLTLGTTYFLKCTDLHGRRASCDGREQLRQRADQRAARGDAAAARRASSLKSATKRVKSAVCTGSKGQRWVHGKFDDVFSQLNCVVRGRGRLVQPRLPDGRGRLQPHGDQEAVTLRAALVAVAA